MPGGEVTNWSARAETEAAWARLPRATKDALLRKRIPHRTGIDEIVSHRKTRTTGATVTVTKVGPGSSFEQDPGWMTMCLNHGQLVFHETRALAMENSSVPEQWCSDCESIAAGKRPKFTGRKIR